MISNDLLVIRAWIIGGLTVAKGDAHLAVRQGLTARGVRITPVDGTGHPVTFWTGRLDEVLRTLEQRGWVVDGGGKG